MVVPHTVHYSGLTLGKANQNERMRKGTIRQLEWRTGQFHLSGEVIGWANNLSIFMPYIEKMILGVIRRLDMTSARRARLIRPQQYFNFVNSTIIYYVQYGGSPLL